MIEYWILATTALAVLALTLIHKPRKKSTNLLPCGHKNPGWDGNYLIGKTHNTPITTCHTCNQTWLHTTPQGNNKK